MFLLTNEYLCYVKLPHKYALDPVTRHDWNFMVRVGAQKLKVIK